MSSPFDNRDNLVEQYRDDGNLRSRCSLHARFSTNKYGFRRWAFDRFEPRFECVCVRDTAERFGLENGQTQLAPWFGSTELRRFENALAVTEVEPLVAYILSMRSNAPALFVEERLEAFREYLSEGDG